MTLLPFSWLEIKQLPKKPIVVLLTSTICLVGLVFFTNASTLPFGGHGFTGSHYRFYHFIYWAISSSFFYLALPIVVIKFIFKERLQDYGWKRSQFFGYYKTYLLIFLLMFPLLVAASYSSRFQSTYPFYVPATGEESFVPYYVTWELCYIVQFFALEFFFRGFMIHGLKSDLGPLSIFIMVIPYCMMHYSKPLPECVASIFAGVFLGLMSYKTQSVWMGSLLHTAVALSMNWLSLWQQGHF